MASSGFVYCRAGLWLLVLLAAPACSTEPQSHPLNTTPVPKTAKVLDNCSLAGQMACSVRSLFSGDAGAERRSACSAFIESDGRRVETCGSIPASQP